MNIFNRSFYFEYFIQILLDIYYTDVFVIYYILFILFIGYPFWTVNM